MKALVLGASGLLGNAIVRELLDRDVEVTALGRRAEPPMNLTGLDVDYVRGDLDSDFGIADVISRHEVLIDAAAPYALHLFASGRGARRKVIELADRRTRRLLDAVSRSEVRFVHIGTTVAQGSEPAISSFGAQRSFARSIHPYFSIKQLIEERILEEQRRGLDAMIIRPSACIGPWDVKPPDECWVPALINGRFSVTPAHRVNVIDSRDVAAGLADALDGGYSGPPIELSGHNTTIENLFSMFCQRAGVSPPVLKVPAEFSVVPSLWAEMALATIGRRSPVPALIPMLICEQRWVDPSAAQLELGSEPRALDDTVADTLAWYRQIKYC